MTGIKASSDLLISCVASSLSSHPVSAEYWNKATRVWPHVNVGDTLAAVCTVWSMSDEARDVTVMTDIGKSDDEKR